MNYFYTKKTTQTQKNIFGNKYFQAFFINFILATICFVPFILHGNGIFVLSDDFNFQHIPFTMLCNEAIKSGDFLWNWNIELGSSLLETMSFYVLGSPLFWVTLLFPSDYYPYLVGWLYILNYALAGLFSYAYIQRFVTNKKYALLGSLLYSFSGFQAVNLLFFHFHNIVAFFPLLLIGLEEKLEHNKRGILAITVFLNALLNFYFFISEVIFLIIYFLVRFTKNSIQSKRLFHNIVSCMIEGVIGVCMSALLFIPSILTVLNNPRASSHAGFSLTMSNREYLQIIRYLFFPGEIMPSQSVIYETDYSSLSAYLPLVSLCLVVTYVIKKKNDWLSILIFVCGIFTIVPVLNNLFTLYTSSYHRWFYMMILVFCLASTLVLEKRDSYPISIISIVTLVFMVSICLFLYVWDKFKYKTIFDLKTFLILSIIAMIGILILFIMTQAIPIQKDNRYFSILFISISVFCVISTAYTLYRYQNYRTINADTYYSKIKAFKEIDCEDEFRISTNEDDSTDMIRNIAMTAPLPSINAFCSAVHPSIMEFYDLLGLERKVFTPARTDEIDLLLSVKYYVTEVADNSKEPISTSSFGNAKYYMYHKDYYLPIGFTYDTYMSQSDYLNLPKEERAKAMLNSLIIPDEYSSIVSKVIPQVDGNVVKSLNQKKLDYFISLHKSECSQNYSQGRNMVKSTIYADNAKFAFFSIPFDYSWKAYVNGNEVDIIPVNNLMAVPISKGENTIELIYKSNSFIISFLISIVGFVSLFCYTKYKYTSKNGKQ